MLRVVFCVQSKSIVNLIAIMKNDYDNKYYLHYYQFNVSDADNTGMGMCIENLEQEK